MDYTASIFELLKILLPAALVFGAAYLVMRNYMDNEHKRLLADMRKEGQKLTTPVRMQAYERLVLLNERINPESMVMRAMRKGLSSAELHQELARNIRTEFEHNLSQQLYVSNAAWAMCVKAKEETLQLVNLAASKMKRDATGIELSKVIFAMHESLEAKPAEQAILILKQEIRRIF